MITSLAWAGLAALPLIIATMIITRLNVPVRLKVWCCRVSFLKLVIGLIPLGFVLGKPALVERATAANANPRFELLLLVLTSLWIAGLAVVLFDLGRGFVASRRLIRETQPITSPEVERLSRQFGIRTPHIRQGNDEGLPFATGIFRPTLVLPVQPCPPNVLAHEIAHVRSRDLAWNLAARLILGAFWFVPFIHKLEAELALWQEAAADQDACRLAACPLKQHAAAIVQSVAKGKPALVWDARLSGNGQLVRRRLHALYSGTGSRVLAVATAAILLAGFTPWRLADPRTETFAPRRLVSPTNTNTPIAAPIADIVR
jgi:beta-lactamase regulating signal transducer with metallopeptidase domain